MGPSVLMEKLKYQKNGSLLDLSISWFLRYTNFISLNFIVYVCDACNWKHCYWVSFEHVSNPLLDMEWQVEFNEFEGRSLLSVNVAWDSSLLCPWEEAMESLQENLDKVSIVGVKYFVPTSKHWAFLQLVSFYVIGQFCCIKVRERTS